jgi:hypothetical protein
LKKLFKLSDSMDQRIVILYYLTPLLILMTALSLLGIDIINNLYVFFSYFWVVTFLSPYSSSKIIEGKYRFSTLRFLYVFNEEIQSVSRKFFKGKYEFINRGIPPIAFVTILWAMLYSGQFYFSILGYVYFEIIHYIFLTKLNWNPFQNV